MSDNKWIQSAIQNPGAFTKKANAAGLSLAAFAKKVLEEGSRANATTKRQANLYKTLKGLRKNK